MRPPAALEARSRPRVHARIREERPRRSDAQGALLRRSVVVVQGRLVHPSPPRRVWPPRRFPGDRFPIWKMIGKLADQAHPATRLRSLMERASKCTDVRARQVHTEPAPPPRPPRPPRHSPSPLLPSRSAPAAAPLRGAVLRVCPDLQLPLRFRRLQACGRTAVRACERGRRARAVRARPVARGAARGVTHRRRSRARRE
jgi:hypothetical protein